MNSDTILRNNAIKYFFDYFEENGEKKHIGVLGCNLENLDGEIVFSGGQDYLGDESHVLKLLKKQLYLQAASYNKAIRVALFNYKLRKLSAQTVSVEQFYVGRVAVVVGADMFMKNNEDARFDENFFMYYEEIDMQYRMQKKGLQSFLISEPKIVHLEGSSSAKTNYEVLDLATFSKIHNVFSKLYFLKKHRFCFLRHFILKWTSVFLWLNPLLYPSTEMYIKKLLIS